MTYSSQRVPPPPPPPLVPQTCSSCPIEAKCFGGDFEPFARAGYYKQDRVTYLECRPSVACVGGNDTARQCKLGYSGIACSSCAPVGVLPSAAVRLQYGVH